MPPKSKKDLQPVQQEDYAQDVVLLTTVSEARLRLGLLATAEALVPEPLSDAAAVPQLYAELLHNSQAPAVSPATTLTNDFILPVSLEQKFRHRKGPDIVDRLINSSLEIRLRDSQTKVVLATAAVDLLPFGLGSNEIIDKAWPLIPSATEEPIKVLPGSTIALSIQLMHQPGPSPPQSAASRASTANTSSSGLKPDVKASPDAAVIPASPILDPFIAVNPDEAAGCNVLEFTPTCARPVPPLMITAASNANGTLMCSMALHLPDGQHGQQLVICSSGTIKDEQLVWAKGCRTYLPPAAVQALKAVLDVDQPLLIEVARVLGSGSAADNTLSDPAFSSYHALLQLDSAAEQLQEPGAVTCAGLALPVGCMSWVVQQGQVSAAGLQPPAPATGLRVKGIEDPPPAVPDGQAPTCPWQTAGTRFAVQIRLAKPLEPPWQPPSKPNKRLSDIIAPRAAPAPPAAPTAADRFRAKVQVVARELAHSFAASTSTTPGNSSSNNSSKGVAPDQQQSLVFELNQSGRYLAIKDQLKQLLLDLVQERYKTAGSTPDTAQLQQLHNDLYVYLMDELHAAIAAVPKQAAASSDAQQQQQKAQPGDGAARETKLLQLAAECEFAGDMQRCHVLHQRRLLLCPTAEAWYQYGAFCMRSKAHTRAEAAFKEALSLDQQHWPSAAALACLGLSMAQGKDLPDAPDPAAFGWVEVLSHTMKDAAGPAAALPWALLALLHRVQGKPKEAQARSCHQEVIRQSKAALAGSSSATRAGSLLDDGVPVVHKTRELSSDAAVAANGYLAAAELCLLLDLPLLAGQLLEAAAGIKDPAGILQRRMQLAAIRAAQQSGDSSRALQVLKELSDQVADGSEEERMMVQLMMGDVQHSANKLLLAKQHYRRASQRAPQLCSPRIYLCLANCFMASGDAAIAVDVYTTCLESTVKEPSAAAWLAPFVLAPVEVGGQCALVWLGLGLAHMRFCDYRECELALSEANLRDPEGPAVWGYLALMFLQQGREADADKALTQAHRHGLNRPELLVETADQYQVLGRFSKAEGLLGKALASGLDNVKVRCKLAAVLLAQHNYEGCQQQLAAAAQQDADDADKELLLSVLQKLQVSWPHL